MARIESVCTYGTVTLERKADKVPPGIVVCLLVALFGCQTVSLGASGPGLGFKVGVQTLDDPIEEGKTTKARLELEISSERFCDDHLDLAFTFGGSGLGTVSDDYFDVVDGVEIEESYVDRLLLLDVRLAARLYPLGHHSKIRPHVGAGLGYFWFLDRWEDEYVQTVQDPLFPDTFYTVIDNADGTDTFGEGFFPFVSAGVTFPLGSNGELMLDVQYDFDKEDSGFDLSGPIYMIGARIRF